MCLTPIAAYTYQEEASDLGRHKYDQARHILESLPDVFTTNNIANFYKPRVSVWRSFLSILSDLVFGSEEDAKVSDPVTDEYKENTQNAFKLLEEAATLKNPDALYTLGDFNFFGNYTHPQNFPESLEKYQALSSLTGNTSATFMAGLMYSTGMFGTIPINQAKATLYYTFAANAGDNRAKMAIAYRHLAGIATTPNFKEAIKYYKKTATNAFHYFFQDSFPGGRYLQQSSWIIPDDKGGVYGEGASYSSSGKNTQKSLPSNIKTAKQAIEYFQYLAEENIVYAHYALAMLFYNGGKTYSPNFELALSYARKGAAYLWKPDGSPTSTRSKLDESTLEYGAHCAGFIGVRYLRGQGVEQDFKQAEKWFIRGIEFQDYISYNNLGFMYYHGIGVEKDINKGVAYIKKAAKQEYGPAYFNLGYAYYQRNHPGDLMQAFNYFTSATKKRNFLAWYYKGIMFEQGFPGQLKSIETAVYYFKVFSESAEELYSPLKWAHDSFNKGDYGSAILGFLIAAEEGYETAQMNLAYLLDEKRGYIGLDTIKSKLTSFINFFWTKKTVSIPEVGPIRNIHREKTALVYWTRAARQMNIDALVKMGDYYFSGIGIEKEDPAKAAVCYQAAADYRSSLAKWNLGWMHENGIGAEQSFHLAKRYYDLAAETHAEAFFPVQLALIKLRVRSFWNFLISDGALNRITGLKYTDDDESLTEKKSVSSFFEGLNVIWNYVFKLPVVSETQSASPVSTDQNINQKNMNEQKLTKFVEDDVAEFSDIDSISLAIVVVVVIAFVFFNRRRAQAQQQLEQQEMGRNVR